MCIIVGLRLSPAQDWAWKCRFHRALDSESGLSLPTFNMAQGWACSAPGPAHLSCPLVPAIQWLPAMLLHVQVFLHSTIYLIIISTNKNLFQNPRVSLKEI